MRNHLLKAACCWPEEIQFNQINGQLVQQSPLTKEQRPSYTRILRDLDRLSHELDDLKPKTLRS